MYPHETVPDQPSPAITAVSASVVACVNCGEVGGGAYCFACGQRRPTGRHTLRSVLGGFVGRFVSIEHGLGHTAALLTIRPDTVITGYWAGRTVRYTHPAGYLLMCVAVFALALRLFSGPTGAADGDRLFTLLLVPMVAGASRVLLWRARHNYVEHLIAVLYLCAHAILGLAILLPGTAFLNGAAATVYGIAAAISAVGYFIWGYSRTFSGRPVFTSAAGLGALVLGGAAWMTLMTMLVNWLSR